MFKTFGLNAVLICSCFGAAFAQSAADSDLTKSELPEPAASTNASDAAAAAATTAAAAPRKGKPSKYDLDRIGSRGVGSGINTYSLERESRLGRRLADEFQHGSRLVQDPLVREYVSSLTRKLSAYSDAPMAFTVEVVDSDEVNASGLPGGYLFVDAGLILATEDEAQLAGVLAHEIAHVAARHATRNRSKRFLVDVASFPLSFAGPVGYTAAGLAGPLSSAKFSRDAENEADLLGLQYMYSAGYDPGEFIRLFEHLTAGQREQRNPRVLRVLIDAPAVQDRLVRVNRLVSTVLPPKQSYVINTSEFDAAKNRLFELANYQGRNRRDGMRTRLRMPRGSGLLMSKPVPSDTSSDREKSKLAFAPYSR